MAGPRKPSYDTVIAEAVADFVKFGFDSAERLEYWTERIREVAISCMGSYTDIEDTVREALTRIYTESVEKNGVLKFAPGVSAFQLQMMRPELHAELQRRIMVSAELIKLDRPQAIDRTLQRFQGWATSVPKGGSPITKRREEKIKIKKALAQLPYQERRVIIDQSAKLFSAINTTVAVNGGALGAFWHSHKLQRDYNGRIEHNKRDGHFFFVPDSWAMKAGYLKKGAYDYTDSVEQPGEFVFCFPAGTSIEFADDIEIGYRRWYDGAMVSITTSSGKTLNGTPNHPILTTKGWVALGLLKEGDYVIEVSDKEVQFAKTHVNRTAPAISDVFASVAVSGYFEPVIGSEKQFHGDGGGSDVDVVHSARELPFRVDFRSGEGFNKPKFPKPDLLRSAIRHLNLVFQSCWSARYRLFHSFSDFASALWSRLLESEQMRVTYATNQTTRILDPINYGNAGYIEALGQRKDAFPVIVEDGQLLVSYSDVFVLPGKTVSGLWGSSFVATPQSRNPDSELLGDFLNTLPFCTKAASVIKVSVADFSDHVYNLQTSTDWFIAQGIVVHNCKCSWQYVFSLRSMPVNALTQKGADALAEARRKVAAR